MCGEEETRRVFISLPPLSQRLFRKADRLHEGTPCRAYVGTHAALHAARDVKVLRPAEITGEHRALDGARRKFHGTLSYAPAAVDALGRLLRPCLFLPEKEQRRRRLAHARGKVGLRDAHHGSAAYHLDQIRVVLVPSRLFADERERSPDADEEIPLHSGFASAHRHGARDKRLAAVHGPGNGIRRMHVVHHASDVRRQSARRHFPPRKRVYQLFLRALRIFGAEQDGLHLRAAEPRASGFESGEGFLLVGLHAYERAFRTCGGGEQLRAPYDFVRSFRHKTAVACDVRLAFRPVDEEIIDFVLRRKFDVRREPRAAHADYAAFADALPYAFGGGILQRRKISRPVFEIVDYDRMQTFAARRHGQLRHRLHRSRYGRVHARGNKTAALAYTLSDRDGIARFNRRRRRRADMLRQRNEKTFRHVEIGERNTCCDLTGGRMSPPAERPERKLQV